MAVLQWLYRTGGGGQRDMCLFSSYIFVFWRWAVLGVGCRRVRWVRISRLGVGFRFSF